MSSRPPKVQIALDHLKKRGDYLEDLPKEWMNPEYGAEYALIAYVEMLESKLKSKEKKSSSALRSRRSSKS